MSFSTVADAMILVTTTLSCPRSASAAFSTSIGGASVNADEASVQGGALYLSVTLSCESFELTAQLSSLLGNITASSNISQSAGFATRVLAVSSATMLSVHTAGGTACDQSADPCVMAVFNLPAAPGYAINMAEHIAIKVPGHLLTPSGKLTSQTDIDASSVSIGIVPGTVRLLPESTFPHNSAGGSVMLAAGGSTISFELALDYFVQPVSDTCVTALRTVMVGDSTHSTAWEAKKAAIGVSHVNLAESTGGAAYGACSTTNAPACTMMTVTMPALVGYNGSETITFGIPAACVGSASAYSAVATRVVTPRQYCEFSGGAECNGHGTCTQDGVFCVCESGWAGIACETSCHGSAKCASNNCPSCSADYNVGSWYNDY